MRFFIAALAMLVGLTTANAQIAGQDDPQFKAALAQWLDGDDLAALTALSELAKADNRAAQVFLARVSEATHTHSHVTGPMERKARIALMRQVGGPSGKSWLKAASEDVPLAAAFLQVKTTWEAPSAIEELLEFNEINAALLPMARLLNTGQSETLLQLSTHPDLPQHISFLRSWATFTLAAETAINSGQRSARMRDVLRRQAEKLTTSNAKFLWRGFQWEEMNVGEAKRMKPNAFPMDLIESPYYAPLKTLCSERCGDDVPKCMRATMIRLYNATPIWITLSSPVETILPTNEYHISPRITDDLVRLLRMTKFFSPEYSKSLGKCSYQMVFAD